MAQPLLARLREASPDTRIDVIAPPWVAPVVRRMAEVEEVIEADLRHGALQLGERRRLLGAIGQLVRNRHVPLCATTGPPRQVAKQAKACKKRRKFSGV